MNFSLIIGDYELSLGIGDGNIYIRNINKDFGEGGDFSLIEFEKVIDKFYRDNV